MTKRSLNDFADQVPVSYASEANTERAFAKKVSSTRGITGSKLTLQRNDGRWVTIIVNPNSETFQWAIHSARIPVFGIIERPTTFGEAE